MSARRITPSPDDFSGCDREPIHLPGSIQPHGAMLMLSSPGLTLAHVSTNLPTVLGIPCEAAIGRTLNDALPALAESLGEDLDQISFDQGTGAQFLRSIRLATPSGDRVFNVAAHRSGPLLVVELEEAGPDRSAGYDALYPLLRAFLDALQTMETVESLSAVAAEEVRRLTGFDRVLVYRFDADWNGTVIAEDRNERLPSYFDLRFPASDIPAQARELYRRNRLRIIPDANYVPVPIEPVLSRGDGQPLDLSNSVLRSVSPVHLTYMRNMGTMASMSVSIVVEDRLWGLISCHNQTPRRVSLPIRSACDFLAQMCALQLASRERAAEADWRLRLATVRTRLLAYMAEEEHFLEGLINHPDELARLGEATGAAVVAGERRWLLGVTPDEPQVERLVAWLGQHHREDVFATDELVELFPEARDYLDRASGVMSISISKVHASYVVWFRPEVVRTVKWGGNPTKPLAEGSGEGQERGAIRLDPRTSFEIWKETVRGRSLPWAASELDAVKELRNAVVGIVLRRAEELASLNEELTRSNKELEAFSYSVSHDLRAPFRHIVGYAELLRTKKAASLDDDAQRYVSTIIASAISAGTLVDNLLAFSQIGRSSLKRLTVKMNAVVEQTVAELMLDAVERRISWIVGDLDSVYADPVLLRLVVENLLSNAVKYTRMREKTVIEVGRETGQDGDIYFVRDNGSGFDMAYVGKLFGVFQRLHRPEEFEGTGIGLANVKRIMERHGGRVWAEGIVDQGATFYFAFPPAGVARHG